MHHQLALIPNHSAAFNFNNRYRIADLQRWPHHWHPNPAWNLGYYDAYWWNNHVYPLNYFAPANYCPTPWMFLLNSGAFWSPGYGYSNYLPYNYNAPITVAVQEIVPIFDGFGNVISYQPETFYYNAYWDPAAGAYGYYDYRGRFHWLTFPWLNTWSGPL